MPLRILKLAISANVDVTTNPQVARFFHVVPEQVTEGTYTIPVEGFETDAGEAATALPDLLPGNSYYKVYINGVLQMAGISSYTPGEVGTGQLAILVYEEETIEAGTPIVLEVVNFVPGVATDIAT